MSNIVRIDCPRCGHMNKVREGIEWFRCDFCNLDLYKKKK